jgi:hypothetical protein
MAMVSGLVMMELPAAVAGNKCLVAEVASACASDSHIEEAGAQTSGCGPSAWFHPRASATIAVPELLGLTATRTQLPATRWKPYALAASANGVDVSTEAATCTVTVAGPVHGGNNDAEDADGWDEAAGGDGRTIT